MREEIEEFFLFLSTEGDRPNPFLGESWTFRGLLGDRFWVWEMRFFRFGSTISSGEKRKSIHIRWAMIYRIENYLYRRLPLKTGLAVGARIGWTILFIRFSTGWTTLIFEPLHFSTRVRTWGKEFRAIQKFRFPIENEDVLCGDRGAVRPPPLFRTW